MVSLYIERKLSSSNLHLRGFKQNYEMSCVLKNQSGWVGLKIETDASGAKLAVKRQCTFTGSEACRTQSRTRHRLAPVIRIHGPFGHCCSHARKSRRPGLDRAASGSGGRLVIAAPGARPSGEGLRFYDTLEDSAPRAPGDPWPPVIRPL